MNLTGHPEDVERSAFFAFLSASFFVKRKESSQMNVTEAIDRVDTEATLIAIEKVLRQARTYMMTAPEEYLPSVTAKFTLEPPNNSLDSKFSAVEKAAIKNIDEQIKREKFFKRLSKALNQLTTVERQLITSKYLKTDPLFNYEIVWEMNISESKFYRLRNRALYRLAFLMGVEKYHKKEF